MHSHPVKPLLVAAWLALAGAICAPQPCRADLPQAPAKAEPGRADRYGDPLPDGALVRLGTLRFRHGFISMGLAFSPDGKLLASKGALGKGVCLWDPTTGRLLGRIEPPDQRQDNRTFSLAFAPDGKTLASAKGGFAHLYDVASGQEVRQLQSNQDPVMSVAFSPDGKLLALGGEKGTISLWDSASGREVRRLPGHTEGVGWVVFSPNSKALASVSLDNTIRLWDVATSKERHRLLIPKDTVATAAFSPDGKLLAAPGKDRAVNLWDAATGKLIRTLDSRLNDSYAKDLFIASVAFAPGGKVLAVGGYPGTVVLLDMDTGQERCRLDGHGPAVASLAFAPDGKTLATAAILDSAPHLWDVATGKEIHARPAHYSLVHSIAFSADGRSLASCGLDRRALLWDLATGQARKQRRIPSTYPRNLPGAFAAGGRLLAYRDGEKTVALWDMDQGKVVRQLAENAAFALAFSADGKVLACGSRDKTICLWDVTAGKELRRLEVKMGQVHGLAFAPDGKRLAAWTRDGAIHVWSVGMGRELRQWQAEQSLTGGLAFSPDGTALGTAEADAGLTRLWEVATGKEVRRLSGQEGCHWIVFSPDGRLVATAPAAFAGDATVRLCETLTGQEVRRFRGHFSGVQCLAFSADGRAVASGGGDATVLVWDVTGRRANGRAQPAPLGAAERERLWHDLGGDAAKAHEAVWRLATAPEDAVPLLQKRLSPVQEPDHQRIVRLITELASERFAVRDKATAALASLGELAEVELRHALDEPPLLEVRQRLERLLAKCSPWMIPSGERLRQLRALAALEYLGTPPARQLLESLAKGTPRARLTQEAQAALRRLVRLRAAGS
jgi:WD40 repeat protein